MNDSNETNMNDFEWTANSGFTPFAAQIFGSHDSEWLEVARFKNGRVKPAKNTFTVSWTANGIIRIEDQ
jgi:hypothetical protein